VTHYYVMQLGLCPSPCGKPATHAVHTSGSARIGTFCKKHAEAKARQWNATEHATRIAASEPPEPEATK